MNLFPSRPQLGTTPLRLSAFALACFAGAAIAGPLDHSIVPANAPWIVHVDVEAAVASKVGSFMLQNKEAFDLEGLDALKVFGIDLTRDLLSVTLFAPGDDESEFDDGVVAAVTTPAIDALWNHLKTEPHARAMTVEGIDILSWDDNGERKYGMFTPSADARTRLVLISEEWENLVAAVKNRGGEHPASAARPTAGSIIFFEARRLPADMIEEGDDNQQALAAVVKNGWMDLAEADATMRLNMSVEFTSPTAAAQARDVLQGLMSFVRLVAPRNSDVGPLAGLLESGSGPKLSVESSRMTLGMSVPADQVGPALFTMKQQEGKGEAAGDGETDGNSDE